MCEAGLSSSRHRPSRQSANTHTHTPGRCSKKDEGLIPGAIQELNQGLVQGTWPVIILSTGGFIPELIIDDASLFEQGGILNHGRASYCEGADYREPSQGRGFWHGELVAHWGACCAPGGVPWGSLSTSWSTRERVNEHSLIWCLLRTGRLFSTGGLFHTLGIVEHKVSGAERQT